ncbi:hypothetical protein SUGI_0381280 [Cryptomeria japonica]|nr:hypothetical protein SUGI_0381280 [Cryptomeria japonica]
MKMGLVCFLLLLFSALPTYTSRSSPSPHTDEDALLSFKHSLTLDPYNSLVDWSPHHSFCNWTGILCSSRHQRVVSLNLTGVIPISLFNCTHLQNLSLLYNNLTGHIPWEIGKLSELQQLLLDENQLTGEIPSSLSNCTQLQYLDLDTNQLSGKVPLELGYLHQLVNLNLGTNSLVGGGNDLSILKALTNCSSLQSLILDHNYFVGTMPTSISCLSSQLNGLDLSSNRIAGNIPSGISNLTKLSFIDLSGNHFNGTIPSSLSQLLHLERLLLGKNNLYGSIPKSLGQVKSLGLLSLEDNMLSGRIPDNLGNLPQLRDLLLHHNQLSGEIPSSLGRCNTLEVLGLSHNKLHGNIPLELVGLKNIQFYFDISNNLLQGSLLVVTKMVMVQLIDVSMNNFSGEIPPELSSCTNLQYLNLSWNSFDGPIPVSLTNLKNLQEIDLSRNNLSGAIPLAFQEMKPLRHINLSSNGLIGEVPKGGVFAKIDESAIMGNLGLCGTWIKLPPCLHSKPKEQLVSKKVIIYVVIGITIFIMFFLLLIFFYRKRHRKNFPLNVWPPKISYDELVGATGGFSEENLIGIGSFGSVYKGILKNGTNIAVKVLNLQDANALQTFDTECNVLKRVRHRNVVKIISTCSNLDFKSLIFPFMSNGSLGRWLYPEGEDECRLNLIDRLRIAKEIAHGMEYLHHHCFVQVIHCDLKPNNVLLGDDMTPYIADFGITKLLFGDLRTSTNELKGSIGYIAPEYGVGGNVSPKGDVYSYGILLMELLTRRRPIDDMFVEGISLSIWVGMHFPNRITEVLDNNLLIDVNESELSMVLSCLTQCMQVGLDCTRELPQQRPNMMEIVKRLEKKTMTFLGTRSFQLPIDIMPFLESTSGLKNTKSGRNEDWSTSTS